VTDIIFYNMWRTEGLDHRTALLARMKDEAPALASKEGFVSMTVLECAEDGRVLVEAHWQSREAFEQAVANDPEAQKSRESLAQLGLPDPLYPMSLFILFRVRQREDARWQDGADAESDR
jgi:heme-degrading monooxygenase HmoA